MSIAYSCMLIVILLPYVWIYLAKFGRREDGKRRRYDNNAPRAQQAELTGLAARALWAHNNAFEAMPGFLAAVLLAAHVGVAPATVNLVALLFVVCRVLHGVLYLANQATLRSAVWMVGLLSVIYLFVESIRHVA